MTNNSKPHKIFRILSISGGGVRGIVPAEILANFEELSGKKITDMFDYIIGTSVGGILAAALTVPTKDGGLKYSSKDVLEMMMTSGSQIFPPAKFYKFKLLAAAYDRDPLDAFLKDKFGDLRFNETAIPISMVSYSVELGEPRTWSTLRAKNNTNDNHFVRDGAGATSAAPTFFSPKQTKSPDGRDMTDIDGAIFANSPTMIGVTELAQFLGVEPKDVMIVSLGTGKFDTGFQPSSFAPKGPLYWGVVHKIATDHMMQASEMADVVQASNLAKNFFRINPPLSPSMQQMDNISPANLQHLKEAATSYAEEHEHCFIQIINCLLMAPIDPDAECKYTQCDEFASWKFAAEHHAPGETGIIAEVTEDPEL